MRRLLRGSPVWVWPFATSMVACVAARVASAPDAGGTPACPRDASRDASGRCACMEGTFLVLGSCVPGAIGDAFCGPPARIGPDGCTFRPCPGDEVIDMASGGCVARASLGRDGAAPCADGAAPLVESGRTACVMPAATCPRGTGRDGATCTRGLRCPAGSLPEGNACRPIVTAGGAEAPARVDVGAWVALVLGVDGGTGKPGLCSPLAQRPAAFGLEPGGAATVNIRVRLGVPDEDVSRVHATVVAADGAGHPLPPSSQSLVSVAVDTLVETLRSLGGAATAGAVEVGVHCGLTLPLRYLPLP